MYILSEHWGDYPVCDHTHEVQWRFWALICFIRLVLYTSIVLLIHLFKQFLEDSPRLLQQCLYLRNLTDGFGLIWFPKKHKRPRLSTTSLAVKYKIGAPRVRLQERRMKYAAKHGRAFALQRAFFGALLRRAATENRS